MEGTLVDQDEIEQMARTVAEVLPDIGSDRAFRREFEVRAWAHAEAASGQYSGLFQRVRDDALATYAD